MKRQEASIFSSRIVFLPRLTPLSVFPHTR
jgi:hypothetical protein